MIYVCLLVIRLCFLCSVSNFACNLIQSQKFVCLHLAEMVLPGDIVPFELARLLIKLSRRVRCLSCLF